MLILESKLAFSIQLYLNEGKREEALVLGRWEYIPELLLILIWYDGIWSPRSNLFGTRWRRLDKIVFFFLSIILLMMDKVLFLRWLLVQDII